MRVALGLKAHSGWAALVALGADGDDLTVVDRRRLELVDEAEASWAKQPYHAAENLATAAARDLVKRGIDSARRLAAHRLKAVIRLLAQASHDVAAGAVLVSDPMPEWTVEEILAVHFRMHKAEGVLFRDALGRAVQACGLKLVGVPEKRLDEQADRTFGRSAKSMRQRIDSLGKIVGPPWGKDQKEAALAAAIALR